LDSLPRVTCLNHSLWSHGGLDLAYQLGRVDIFEDVALSADATSFRLFFSIRVRSEDDDTRAGALFGQAMQRGQSLSIGSLGLQQYDIGLESHRVPQAGPPATGAANDFKLVSVTQSSFKCLAYNVVVINDEQSR
jgi:hypothetical protein